MTCDTTTSCKSLPVDQIVKSYFSYLDQHYQRNARRFMLVKVPQLEYGPTYDIMYDYPYTEEGPEAFYGDL